MHTNIIFLNTSCKDDGLVSCSFNRSSTVCIPLLESCSKAFPFFDICFKCHTSSLGDGFCLLFTGMTKSHVSRTKNTLNDYCLHNKIEVNKKNKLIKCIYIYIYIYITTYLILTKNILF